MLIRELIEEREFQVFSPYASFSRNSKGRNRKEKECDVRTVYMRDRDRILHSKAFRRLKDKTQVFLSPQGDHYRTRLMHTLEVSQISRTVARALRLNEDLVEAISLGHDLGHTPFGHAGERALRALSPHGFHHAQQSLRVSDFLEKSGKGLNLTAEVRDGILNHQMRRMPSTLEGKVVRLCDKFAYIHHDTDDAMRAGIIKGSDIPQDIRNVLGDSPKDRLNTMVNDLVMNSSGKENVEQSEPVRNAMVRLREFLFQDVYTNPTAKYEEVKVNRIIGVLYEYYRTNPDAIPREFMLIATEHGDLDTAVCDYISGMTDQYCIHKFEEIYVPRSWDVF